jgi:hypothetical protein
MEEFLEILGIMCLFVFPFLLTDPEVTMNRIGRSIHAFRRGLAGETIERQDEPVQPERRRD